MLFLAALMRVRIRAAGDVPGHEFHGNQWTHFPSDDTKRTLDVTVEKAFIEHYASWGQGLTADQKGVIKSYTAGSFTSMNRVLRGNGPAKQNPEVQRKIDVLQKTLLAAPAPPPGLVYRAVSAEGKLGHEWAAGLKPGDEIKLNGFQSTSLKPGTATGSVHLEIIPKQGAYIQSLTKHPEKEFLIPHGQTFRVHASKDLSGRVVVQLVAL